MIPVKKISAGLATGALILGGLGVSGSPAFAVEHNDISFSTEQSSAYFTDEMIQELALELEKAFEDIDFSGLSVESVAPSYSLRSLANPNSVADSMTSFAQCVLRSAFGIPTGAILQSAYDEIGTAIKLKRWNFAARKIAEVVGPLIAKGVVKNIGGPIAIAAGIAYGAANCDGSLHLE